MSDEKEQSEKPLSAEEREKNKTVDQRTADYAYTMNHALSCGATDIFVQTPISNWVTKQAASGNGIIAKIAKVLERLIEKDAHSHTANCGHQVDSMGRPKNGLRDWFVGEAFGDVGAVPMTVLVQRLFPGFMQGLRGVLEPISGWAFRMGAQRDAKEWAKKNNVAADSPQAKAKEQAFYEHEMEHLPQAAVWNFWSIPINLFVQKKMMNSAYSWPELLLGKTFGSVFSNGVLLGGRATLPEAFTHWDNFNSEHIIGPTTKVLGKVFGMSKEMEEAQKEEKELKGSTVQYEGRVEAVPEASKDTTR